nr:histidine kinase [uncultured Olsenella sp.]
MKVEGGSSPGSARAAATVLALALAEGLSLLALSAPDQQGSSPANAALALLGASAFAALVALALRLARQAARSRREALEADRRRREAEARARIAGELHDSVGHDLTAIIALTEGVGAATRGDARLAHALARVNELARAGLADTRRAVAGLEEPEPHAGRLEPSLPGRHGWEEIPQLLAEARMSGRAAPFSEVGRRPDDPRQAGLAYLVVREGVTNSLRHARHANCIAASLEHVADGSCRVAVRDDGEPSPDGPSGGGTGLRRLSERVRAAGGKVGWGADEGGWSLEAAIPPSAGEDAR